ncbi:hypothetical protein QOZ86_01570 [Blastococcus capsensis]|nr:hypothetical protein [Blastococcus capsensis]MDK3255181.1 hypothetical protein [Blastococcus capsensis]
MCLVWTPTPYWIISRASLSPSIRMTRALIVAAYSVACGVKRLVVN